jgi:hypothetical protein
MSSNKIINLPEEGETIIPYKTQLDQIYRKHQRILTPNVNSELLTTSLYFFYIDKVYHGLETAKSDEMEWFLPGKAILYHLYRFFNIDPSLIKKTRH